MIDAGQYAFIFDASACSGCMACQVACKDKHRLEVGRCWRRVYEISGGGWRPAGNAWITDAFAYHYSVACNHCEAPICTEVCPTAAIIKRPDGIVLLEPERCLGCSYCSWACPYDALQVDRAAGRMSKCTFCVDEIDAGRPPVCVAACPMRVLDYRFEPSPVSQPIPRQPDESGRTNGSYPLPAPDLTRPALVIKSHKDEARSQLDPLTVRPVTAADLNAWPLILFTLLVQLAVGATLVLAILRAVIAGQLGQDLANDYGTGLASALLMTVLLSLLISTLHLGNPRIAYLALTNWSSSWLSREIGLSLFFTGLVATFTLLQWTDLGSYTDRSVLLWAAGLVGLILVYAMSRVYRLRTVPGWFPVQTTIHFSSTTLLLGGITGSVIITGAISGGAGQAAHLFGRAAGSVAAWWGVGLILLFIASRLAGVGKIGGPESKEVGGEKKPSGRLSSWFGLPALLPLPGILLATIPLLGRFPARLAWLASGLALTSFGLVLLSEIAARHDFYRAYGHHDRRTGGLKSD